VLDLFAENAYLVVRNLQIIETMIGKKPAEHQMSIFEVALESFIDMNHELVLLSKQIARLTGYEPVEALTEKARKKFCKRAGIEPVIGHLKSDYRMMRNYFKGTLGDAINTMMAAAAYNMRHLDEQTCLVFFCLLAAGAGRTPRECVI